MKQKSLIAILLLLTLGIVTRFLPHPANFTAIGAITLFGGLYLPKKWAILAPLTVVLISDIFIGFYSVQIMTSVYAGFLVMGLIGLKVRKNNRASSAGKKSLNILGGTLFGSLIFFLLTNFAVWMFGTMYTHNLSGLMQSYYMAIPFFKNSLMANLLYTGILVGSYEYILHKQKNTKIIQQTI